MSFTVNPQATMAGQGGALQGDAGQGPQKRTLEEQIKSLLRETTDEVSKHDIARRLGTVAGRDFGLAFSAAQRALVREGVDWQPVGRGGVYRRAKPKVTGRRGNRDINTGLRKIQLGKDKAALSRLLTKGGGRSPWTIGSGGTRWYWSLLASGKHPAGQRKAPHAERMGHDA